jgi:hypothetical protein
MKGGQQTPVNTAGLNGYFVYLEKVQMTKISLLTRHECVRETTLLSYVILKHVTEGKIEGRIEVKGR